MAAIQILTVWFDVRGSGHPELQLGEQLFNVKMRRIYFECNGIDQENAGHGHGHDTEGRPTSARQTA